MEMISGPSGVFLFSRPDEGVGFGIDDEDGPIYDFRVLGGHRMRVKFVGICNERGRACAYRHIRKNYAFTVGDWEFQTRLRDDPLDDWMRFRGGLS